MQDFTEECDLGTEEGVAMLRDFLEKKTDLTCMSSDENIRSVDIGFPIHFLQVKTSNRQIDVQLSRAL